MRRLIHRCECQHMTGRRGSISMCLPVCQDSSALDVKAILISQLTSELAEIRVSQVAKNACFGGCM
jgi:hypothetical protein